MIKFLRLSVLAVLLFSLVAVMACAGSEEEGNTVKVGFATLQTGAASALMADSNQGYIDYIDYINEGGGIEYTDPDGGTDYVKIDLMIDDHAFSPAKAVSIYKRQKDAGCMVVSSVGATATESISEMCSRDEICLFPIWTYASENIMAPDPLFTAGNYDNPCSVIIACFEWFKEFWDEEGNTGTPKVGQLRLDSSGTKAAAEAVSEYVDDIPVELVGTEYAPINAADYNLNLQRLIDAGAVCIAEDMVSPITFYNSAEYVGFDFDDVVCISTAGCISESFIDMDPDACEGRYSLTQVALPSETDKPGVQLGIDICQEYQGHDPTLAYMAGILQGMQLCDVIQMALEEVGYDDLDGEAINYQLHHLTDWDSQGLCPLVTVDPEYPVTLPHCKVIKVENGEFVTVSDWYEYPPTMRD